MWSGYWVRSASGGAVARAPNETRMRPDGGSDRLEIVRIAPVEIDPQEVSIIESLAHPIGQRDLAIVTVGVV